MRITDFKKQFKAQLSGDYPSTEIDSFFNLLLENYLGLTRLALALNPETTLTSSQKDQFEEALNRLQNHEPIQYIIGETEFYGLDFKVDANVLIPRPETEELVDWIISDSVSTSTSVSTSNSPLITHHSSLLDIGTGSGCIAIALAKNLPRTRVSACDISENALKLAKQNAAGNGVQVDFKKMDILNPQSVRDKFDVIVSNPPYVRKLERAKMQRNVLEHEPGLALFVENTDALLFYRKILDFAKTHLTENGRLYFEINQYLTGDLKTLFQERGITDFEFKNDIFGNPRMAKVLCSKL